MVMTAEWFTIVLRTLICLLAKFIGAALAQVETVACFNVDLLSELVEDGVIPAP